MLLVIAYFALKWSGDVNVCMQPVRYSMTGKEVVYGG